jgi:hypothetical protein
MSLTSRRLLCGALARRPLCPLRLLRPRRPLRPFRPGLACKGTDRGPNEAFCRGLRERMPQANRTVHSCEGCVGLMGHHSLFPYFRRTLNPGSLDCGNRPLLVAIGRRLVPTSMRARPDRRMVPKFGFSSPKSPSKNGQSLTATDAVDGLRTRKARGASAGHLRATDGLAGSGEIGPEKCPDTDSS